MTNKELYIDFVKKTKIYIPIFSKPWWLEATALDNWDVFIATTKSKEIMAVHPYYYSNDGDQKIIQKAPLTQNNGVLFNYPTKLKYTKKLTFEKKALNIIIDEIENIHVKQYRQYFHYSFKNWLPYYWKGFSQTTRYTYVINSISMSDVYSNMDTNLKKNIKKAEKIVNVFEGMSISTFYDMNKMTYERQGIDIPYSYDIVKRIADVCNKNNAYKIFYAVDDKQNIHSTIFLVEDEKSVYYLMSGSNPDYRSSQSLSLLLVKGIEYALRQGKVFDFEGSMKQNIERNFAQFGGIQTPYMDISKKY